MKDFDALIEINPRVMMGKPVIKGTRITVELILDKLSAGEKMDDILIAHTHIKQKQVLAALAFASEILKHEKIYPIVA
jgi:uncharacterized protein (DUF433 family)